MGRKTIIFGNNHYSVVRRILTHQEFRYQFSTRQYKMQTLESIIPPVIENEPEDVLSTTQLAGLTAISMNQQEGQFADQQSPIPQQTSSFSTAEFRKTLNPLMHNLLAIKVDQKQITNQAIDLYIKAIVVHSDFILQGGPSRPKEYFWTHIQGMKFANQDIQVAVQNLVKALDVSVQNGADIKQTAAVLNQVWEKTKKARLAQLGRRRGGQQLFQLSVEKPAVAPKPPKPTDLSVVKVNPAVTAQKPTNLSSKPKIPLRPAVVSSQSGQQARPRTGPNPYMIKPHPVSTPQKSKPASTPDKKPDNLQDKVDELNRRVRLKYNIFKGQHKKEEQHKKEVGELKDRIRSADNQAQFLKGAIDHSRMCIEIQNSSNALTIQNFSNAVRHNSPAWFSGEKNLYPQYVHIEYDGIQNQYEWNNTLVISDHFPKLDRAKEAYEYAIEMGFKNDDKVITDMLDKVYSFYMLATTVPYFWSDDKSAHLLEVISSRKIAEECQARNEITGDKVIAIKQFKDELDDLLLDVREQLKDIFNFLAFGSEGYERKNSRHQLKKFVIPNLQSFVKNFEKEFLMKKKQNFFDQKLFI